jgi:hypothetical protein
LKLIGKLNAKVAPVFPLKLLFSVPILPPCFSIILLEINRPNPVPPVSDLVANFVKSFGNISGCIPACILYFDNNLVAANILVTITVMLPRIFWMAKSTNILKTDYLINSMPFVRKEFYR